MDRIRTDSSATLTVTVYDSDGEAVNADGEVTVQVDDDLGNEVVAATAATKKADEIGIYEHTLAPADIPDPTVLEVTWSGNVAGAAWQYVQRVDVAGGRYIRLGELRGRRSEIASYPTATLRKLIAVVEDRIDKATNTVWVPRYHRQTVDAPGGTILDLPHRDVRELVRVVDEDGNTVATTDWIIRASGALDMDVSFDRGDPIDVAYRHGRDAPPADLAEAALDAADLIAKRSTQDLRRAAQDVGEAGGFPFQLASYRHDRPFGIDGVDAVVTSRHTLAVG